VIILSLVPPKRSHSAAAQGGMQASLGNTTGAGDNEDVHFEDTVRGSDWGATRSRPHVRAYRTPGVRELAAWGVPWNRVQQGPHEVVMDGQRVTLTERRGPRPDHRPRFRRHQEMAHLLRLRRHRPRHALRGQRPGHRRRHPGA
jgi:succinate dehydrogenase/fumarate reductase flavoprotein subunit